MDKKACGEVQISEEMFQYSNGENKSTNQPSLDALVEKEELCQYHPSLQGGTAELEEVSSSSQLRTPGKSKAIEKNHGTNTKLIKMSYF